MKFLSNPRSWLLSLALLLLGLLLILIPSFFSPGISYIDLSAVTVVPPSTWQLLPTRYPDPTPTATRSPVDAPLQTMHHAFLTGDTDAAKSAWEEAYSIEPQNGIVRREGARLSLALGEMDIAEAHAWKALRALPKDSTTWALLGLILAQRGEHRAATQALGVAESLAPELAQDMFTDRWRTARYANDINAIASLSQAQSRIAPDNPLTFYYRATALLSIGETDSAIEQLISILESEPVAPAVLWHTLGEAYLARQAYTETVTVLEVAGARFAQGDTSLTLNSPRPEKELSLALGYAYLGNGRCADAESIFRRLSETDPMLTPFVEQAIICQTPTPTMTPWIISQQVTPTPTPGN